MPWKPVCTCGFLLGLLLFLRGFFLTRRELGKIASHAEDCSLGELVWKRISSDGRPCGNILQRGRYKRGLLLVVDGLRYDFATNETHFPFLHSLLRDNTSQTRLFNFRADSPTVTAQRLKGLTTGTLPTFVDVGSNLNSSAITDDNIIDQLRAQTEELAVLGDDTWKALFPRQFLHSIVFDSFNTKDIDTVDNGILRNLPHFLRNPSSWRLLVAHFLGVDHIGHSHSAFHPLMAERLQLMDHVLQEAVRSLPQDGFLLLFGDHGMTDEGEHGGSSPEETDSALFVYFPTPQRSFVSAEPGQPVPQIDLVPTLATLLSLPIPFSSLGKIIPCLFDGDKVQEAEVNGQRVLFPSERLEHFSRNALQVWRYLRSYFPHQIGLEPLMELERVRCEHLLECIHDMERSLQEPPQPDSHKEEDWLVTTRRQLLDALRCHLRLISSLNSQSAATAAHQHEVEEKYLRALQYVQDSARRMWTQFRSGYALCGLAAMSIAFVGLGSKLTDGGNMVDLSRIGALWAAGMAFHMAGAFSNSFVAEERTIVFSLLQAGILWQGLASLRTTRMASTAVLMAIVRLLNTSSLWSWLERWQAALLALHWMACVGLCFDLADTLSPRRFTRFFCVGYLGLQLLVTGYHSGVVAGILVPRVVVCGAAGLLLSSLALSSSPSVLSTQRTTSERLSSPQPAPLLLTVHVIVSLYVIKAWHCAVVSCALALLVFVLRHAPFRPPHGSVWRTAACCSLWARWVFFATEHAFQMDKLHLSVAFVGKDTFHVVYGGVALLVNTAGSEALALLAAASCAEEIPRTRALWTFLWIRMALTLAASAAAWALRRHLMLWAVFAPKLVFETLFLLTASIGVHLLVWSSRQTPQERLLDN